MSVSVGVGDDVGKGEGERKDERRHGRERGRERRCEYERGVWAWASALKAPMIQNPSPRAWT